MLKWLPLVCVLACGEKPTVVETSDTGPTSTTPTTSTTVPGFEGLSISVDACREATVRVTWTGAAGATSYVRYGSGDVLEGVTPSVTDDTSVDIVIRGLINGETVRVQAVSELTDGSLLEAPAQEVSLGFTPPNLQPLMIDAEVTDPARSEVYGGHLLLSTLGAGASYAAIMDASSGQYTWWLTVDDPNNEAVGRAHLSADGQTVFWNDYDRERIDDIANVYGSDIDGCDTTTTRTLWGHHDFVELEDGKAGWLGFTYDEALKVPGYGAIPVVADNIYEASLGATKGEEVEVWNALTDWDCPVYWTGDAMDLGVFVPNYHEWTHANSLAYLEEDDAYFILMRYTNALVKVDRATGATVWTMGGPCGTVSNTAGDTPFWSYPHFSHAWREDGALHVLIFDNGDEYTPRISRVVEYVIDEKTGAATEVWDYPHPEGSFMRILGDARRLSGGNTLIAWAPTGMVEEVTPEKERVWLATSNLGQTMGRVTPIGDLYDAKDSSL